MMMASCNRQAVVSPVTLGTVSLPSVLSSGLYTVSVLQTLAEFREIRQEWEALFDESGEVSANLDFGWLDAWLENFLIGKLFVIAVRNESGRLVGAAPFKIVRPKSGLNRRLLRHVQFIGTEPCLHDEMKILVHPAENAEAILREVAYQLIRHHREWDVIDLRYCPDEAQLQTLMAFLQPVMSKGGVRETMASPFYRLPASVEEYRDRNGKNRRKLRQYENRLKRDFPGAQVSLRQIEDSREIDEHLDRLADRHIEYWAERGVTSNFARYPQMKAFYRNLLKSYPASKKNGRVCVRFSALMLDDEVMSYDLGLGQRDGYLCLIPCYMEKFNRYAPGFALFEKIIEQSIRQDDTHFYLGRGDEPYKSQWCDEHMRLYNLRLFRSRHAALMWRCDEILKKLLGRKSQY